eukprot:TRINITY_DN11582_c0_g1_i5.p1 TRINITY_DN11582_c0_g1~~TRINITY_DN11582_c0_g1_i5.p1  ORF type:complete len:592 (+),score=81.35 TRINITY_DN11582_c0_g1_i5:76-1851(+)
MDVARLAIPVGCLAAPFLCTWSTRRHIYCPSSALRPVIEHVSTWWKTWQSPKLLDEQEQLLEERVQSRLMEYRLAFASVLCLVFSWALAVYLVMRGMHFAASFEGQNWMTSSTLFVLAACFLAVWVGSFIDLKQSQLDVLFSFISLCLGVWQLMPFSALAYLRATFAVYFLLLSCIVRDQRVAVAGVVVVYACRGYTGHKFFDNFPGERSFAAFVVQGLLYELWQMVVVLVSRLCANEASKYMLRAKLTEKSANVESKSLNKMVAGLSDCLVRLDHRLHLSGDPQKLPQLLRSVSSTFLHWEKIDFMKYVTDEDKDRFRKFVSESKDSTESSMAEAMHFTSVNGSGVRVFVQLFHAPILDSLKDETHLLAFKDLSQEQEAAAAAADTVFDLAPRSSIGSVKSVSASSVSSGASSKRRKTQTTHTKKHAKDETLEVDMIMQLEAQSEGVRLVKYEVELKAAGRKKLATRLERFVKPSDWLNLNMALESKLDLKEPSVGISTYEHPISFNLPLLGMVSPSELRIFIPDHPQEGQPTKVIFIPRIEDSKDKQEDKRRRIELHSRASNASGDDGIAGDAPADPLCIEISDCKLYL